MAAPPPPPAGGGMSLYANLLESTDGSASISREPVKFNEPKDDAPAKKFINPALQFQPIRRPQLKQPNRPKPGFPKAPPAVSPAAAASAAPSSTPSTNTAAPVAPAQPRSTLADWAAAEDDDYGYAERERRQRGGRRKKKKKAGEQQIETDWDEIYDPTRPTNVEEYLRSEERIREVREWKAVLYAHRRRSREKSYSDEEDERPRMGLGNQFAPPASFNFAPPPRSPPRAPAAAPVPDDLTGDDAYTRRLALSNMFQPAPAPPPPPPPPPAAEDTATISRAPVRYSPPPPPPPPAEKDDDAMSLDSDTEVNYSSIPIPENNNGGAASLPEKTRGRAFAKKLMTKYGWTAGTGLGASNSGITTALRVETIKRRKKPDSEGGGYAEPKGQGRIIAPKAAPNTTATKEEGGGGGGGGFGKMSTVIVLSKMLDNMENLEEEIEAGLGQEIGEECGEKYGRVERVKFEVGTDGNGDGNGGRRVFIKFVEGVSALRAVNALQGRVFNGNTLEAKFFDEETFEKGEYE